MAYNWRTVNFFQSKWVKITIITPCLHAVVMDSCQICETCDTRLGIYYLYLCWILHNTPKTGAKCNSNSNPVSYWVTWKPTELFTRTGQTVFTIFCFQKMFKITKLVHTTALNHHQLSLVKVKANQIIENTAIASTLSHL